VPKILKNEKVIVEVLIDNF